MTVLDGDVTPQDISELVALSDHAAFSEPGLARLTDFKNLKRTEKSTNAHKWTCLRHAGERVATGYGYALQHQPDFEVDR
jgi:sulfofructose kinase